MNANMWLEGISEVNRKFATRYSPLLVKAPVLKTPAPEVLSVP